MRANHLDPFDPSGMGRFLAPLKDRVTGLPYAQIKAPVLYLRFWESDYPYLHGNEGRKRWLPAVVPSPNKSPLLPL